MIRILIAEDQSLVRGALAHLLQMEDDFEVVGQAPDGAEAVRLAIATEADIALLDIEMPKKNGLDVVAELQVKSPHTKSVLVTTFARPGYLQLAMQRGARGYLLKAARVEELAEAIRSVHQGQVVIDKSLMQQAFALSNPLTQREIDVLRAAQDGLTTREISRHLHLSEGTVRNYLSQVIAKLDSQNRQEAVRKATANGWI